MSVGDICLPIGGLQFIKGDFVDVQGKIASGDVVVLELFATWCGPCHQSIPHVSELQQRFPNVYIVGISDSDNVQVRSSFPYLRVHLQVTETARLCPAVRLSAELSHRDGLLRRDLSSQAKVRSERHTTLLCDRRRTYSVQWTSHATSIRVHNPNLCPKGDSSSQGGAPGCPYRGFYPRYVNRRAQDHATRPRSLGSWLFGEVGPRSTSSRSPSFLRGLDLATK